MTGPDQLAAFDPTIDADQLTFDDVAGTPAAPAAEPVAAAPGPLLDMRPAELLDRHRDHRLAIVEHLTGSRRLDDATLGAHALGSLAAAEALVDRLLGARWETAAVALRSGARVRDVADVCGVTDGDVADGVRVYATRLPVDRADVLLALVAEAGR